MGRPPTGQVVERDGREGRTYALRFRAYGRREYLTLGSTAEGWSRERAERELRHVLADVERGIWRPPDREPAEPPIEPTFHEFASEWFEHRCRELRPSTVEAIRWRLTYVLLPFFAEHRLSEITAREVDRYRQAQVRERDRLRAAVAAGQKVERRPLSNSTIQRSGRAVSTRSAVGTRD